MIHHPLPLGFGVCLVVACASASSETLSALEPTAPTYRVTRWTAEQGLPENNIKALAQTREGYLWIGTLYGLIRFDGLHFRVFDHSTIPEITHDSVNDLAEDTDERGLWVSTGSGLLFYCEHAFKRFGTEHGIPGSVGPLCSASQGGVWFSPQSGRVGLAKRQNIQTWDLGAGLSDSPISQIVEESPSSVLVVVGGRPFRLNPNSGSVTNVPLPASRDTCESITLCSTNEFWVCGRHEIWMRDQADWHQELVTSETGAWPCQIYQMHDRTLWVRESLTDRSTRLRRLSGHRLWPLNIADFPSDANVTRVIEDKEGSLWVGTTTGLFRLEPKRLKVFSCAEGMRNDETVAVTAGRDGTIWVGTAAGVSAVQKDLVHDLPQRPPVSQPQRCAVLLADHRGRLWAQDQVTGLRVFENGEWRPPGNPNRQLLLWGGVRSLGEDRQGRLWIGTQHGIICQDFGSEQVYSRTDGLSCEDIRVIHQDASGDMWFGSFGGGINCLHDGKITSYRTPRSEHNNRMWCIHEDADGIFWIGSEEGLNRFVPPGIASPENRFFVYTTRQGLRENVINNIQEDDLGYLWLSGLRGIYRISRQELNEMAAGKRNEVHCYAIGEADGMLSCECNGGDDQPAGCKDAAGRIWFPTAKGIVAIDPRRVATKEVPPPVVIEQVLADNEVVYGDGLKVAPGETPAFHTRSATGYRFEPGSARVIEISYTANSLTAPEKISFRHRLNGDDPGWQNAGNRRVARYTNLRPGHYEFQVIAANSHGVWNPSPAKFNFSLDPYFWQTWPFYLLCAGAGLGLTAAIQGYRLRWQRRLLKLEEQRALANERARIARDLHDDLGTALTGLALELDVARREAAEHSSLAQRFGQTAASARDLANRMREVVWTINPRCDSVAGLASFLDQMASQFLQAAGLKVRVEFPESIPTLPLSGEARHQLALAAREALTNVVRHAGASQVVLSLKINEHELFLQIQDNGRGFQVNEAPGRGLANMRVRLEQSGGRFGYASTPGLGTTVVFRLPLGPDAPP